MSDVIPRIKAKLAYLREHEDFDAVGADIYRQSLVYAGKKYGYTLKAPATEAQIAAFEAQHKIQLPEDYRRFLLEVGTGGAGPGYDLYSPFDEDAPYHGNLQTPFPFIETMRPDVVNAIIESLAAMEGIQEPDAFGLSGLLMVGYSGCQCWHLLIISGAARGQIWFMDGSFYAPVMLSGTTLYVPDDYQDTSIPADATRANFTQWYEAWLDNAIAIAQNHWRKRGRAVPPLRVES